MGDCEAIASLLAHDRVESCPSLVSAVASLAAGHALWPAFRFAALALAWLSCTAMLKQGLQVSVYANLAVRPSVPTG